MPPTASPSTVTAASPAAPLPGTWSGPLGFVNQPSSDGRYLALGDPAALESRQMPVPLLYQADLAPGHDGGTQGLGVINRAWVQGNQLMGEGCFDMADPVAAELARKVADGFLGWTSVDLEPTFQVSEDYYDTQSGRLLSSLSPAELAELADAEGLDINPVNYEGPDQVAQDDRDAERDNTIPIPSGRYAQPVTVFDGWKLMSATLVSQPAFADARIAMDIPASAAVAADACPACPPSPDLIDARKGKKAKASGAHCAGCGGAMDELKKSRAKAAKAKMAGGAPPEHGEGCECGAACACTEMQCACGCAAATALLPPRVGKNKQAPREAVTAHAGGERAGQIAAVMARFRAEGVFGLPVAEGNPDWDAAAAAARIAAWASSDGSGDKDKVDWGRYGQGFLYKDPDGGENVGAYKLPYADVIGGTLQVVPKAVFAVAARLDSASLPDAAKGTVKGKVRALYAAIGTKQGRTLDPPFAADGPALGLTVTDAGQQRGPVSIEQITDGDAATREQLAKPDTPVTPTGGSLAQTPVGQAGDNDEQGKPMPNDPSTALPTITVGGRAVTAGAAPLDPPAAWFSDPALPGPTPVVITRSGRVMGHLALFGSCHTGFPGDCVSPPKSKTGYSLFHVGSLITREGDELAVGKIVLGTDHASTSASVSAQSAMAHYADTGCAVAVVRAGEDEFGIWVAGALVPEATDEQVAALRRSPLSGDWRRYGANLELIAALAVNAPGFPVPRASARTEHARVAALTAAGVLTPLPPKSPCAGGFEIDVDSLAEAVVMRAEAIQRRRADLVQRRRTALAIIQSGHSEARAARAAAARRIAQRESA